MSVDPHATEPAVQAAATDQAALLERLTQRDKEIEQLNDAVLKLREELKSAQKKLEDVHNSTSWRMTAVFRGPIMRLINIKRTWELLAFDVASRGGWHDMLAEIGRDMRTQRLQYLKQVGRFLKGASDHQPVPGSGPYDRNDYHAWRAAGKAAHHPEKANAEQAPPPLISVLIPTYKPPLDLLQQAIASVTDQPYDRWEICIADDASNDPALEAYLRQLAQDNERIRVRFREKNGHISACTNTALELASGDYLLLLDQDDLLHPQAMQRVAECIQANPDAAIIYSDEDRINEDATRHSSAYFKPDFNYDLFLGQNMVSHLGVFQRQLILDIGGFRVGLEGSQDYDLALRAMERVKPHQIRHIPQVLYHWRAIKGSTALDHSEKSYASTAGRRAIQDHLERTDQKGEALPAPGLPFFNRVRYDLPPEDKRVSVLVALDEPKDKLLAMLQQMWEMRGDIEVEFIVCTTTQLVLEDLSQGFKGEAAPAIRIIRTDPQTPLPVRLNTAIEQASGHFCCLVTVLFTRMSAGWLEELARVSGQQRAAFVAPRVHNLPGQLDHGGILFTDALRAVYAHKGEPKATHGYAGRAALQQEFCALSPALLVIRRTLLQETGGLGGDFGSGLCLVDKCLELQRLGLANVWMPYAELVFSDPAYSGRTNILTELGLLGSARRRWTAKWGEAPYDPFYNPNLSRRGDFSLNWQV